MNHTAVESLIARCLMQPGHLQLLLASSSPPFERSELERLRLFGGLITKVQHNDLWDDFPATRQLLARAGIELAFFAEYRLRRLAPGGPKPSRESKYRRFGAFLEDYLREKPCSETAGLKEVFRHEWNVWQVSGRACSAMETGDGAGTAGTPIPTDDLLSLSWTEVRRMIPRFNGCFLVARFSVDPVRVIATLDRRRAKLPRVPRTRPVTLGYWNDGRGDCRVLLLASNEAAVLSHIDGKRTVGTVVFRARRGGLRFSAPREFKDFFSEGAASGLVTLCDRKEPGESRFRR